MEKFLMDASTAHLASALLDRVLGLHSFDKNQLQLVAMSCIIVAAKAQDTDAHVPTLSNLEKVCGGLYKAAEFRQMEIMVLKVLKWKVNLVTTHMFLQHFDTLGVLGPGDQCG
jgi:hypothetical protein